MLAAVCGARTRSGRPCRAPGVAGGRCYHHAGMVSVWHEPDAFYVSALPPDEAVQYGSAAVGCLDDEIRLAKLMLFRLVRGAAGGDAVVDKQLEMIRKLELARLDLLAAAGRGAPEGPLGELEIEVVGGVP